MLKFFKIKPPQEIYLLGIILLAFTLRVSFLGTIPNGFFTDEASYSYDSYSILHTLRDQYGKFLPFFFKSANDYREGLYIYLMVPFLKLFGLSVFSARLTSAVIGTLTVLILYYLAQELFNQRVALFAALFLAISPWHIHFSRIAFRTISVPLLFCLSLFIFLKSLKKPNFIPLAGLLFGISIYTYNSARVFVPLFLLGLIIIYKDHLWKHKKQTLWGLILFLLIFIPQLIYHFSDEGGARASAVGILPTLSDIINSYFSYFSSKFLFFQGDPIPRHTVNKMGELYSFEFFTIIIGLITLIKNKVQGRGIIFLWLLLYPIPAALISPSSAVRTCVGPPIFALISAYGLITIIDIFQGNLKLAVKFTISLILVAGLTVFCQRYFVEYPKYHTDVWFAKLGNVINYADKSQSECLVMSDNIHGKYIYIMIPFYTQFPPAEYQKLGVDVVTDKLDMGRWKVLTLNNYKTLDSNCLYVISKNTDEKILQSKGYKQEVIYAPRDINNDLNYELVRISKNN
ncbi:ArnT family glycosyltransferase [Aphanothece sacrum]|uniref:Glycosyl transferase n=1 Tax=Aphanothece sacrum FPU1 TaxID=1920663 RepID=A0A401IM15_APHSA|nr:glycosyltransferase family 39 protein [Aphanothece sacrum]GBF82286.1 glycosyl transferase [Aphanothece sacrum FPU1]GBF84187.1 glycosyl transferase [Aphanothece sacrum FPU3]